MQHYDILCKLWEVVGADIFMINSKNLIFIVDYYSKFSVVKKSMECLSVQNMMQAIKVTF